MSEIKWNLKNGIQGSIPARLKVFTRSPRIYSIGLFDGELEADRVVDPYVADVSPAFVCDADKPKTFETAEKWATRNESFWNESQRAWDALENTAETMGVFELSNSPAKIKIVGAEKRQEGGRAWKVVCVWPELKKQGHTLGALVDLREDVLLDALLVGGIGKGGEVGGEFIWAKMASQMRLVRVGSPLHEALQVRSEKNSLKNLPVSKYEIGGAYVTRDNNVWVYIGKFDYDDLSWHSGRAKYPAGTGYDFGYPDLNKLVRDKRAWIELGQFAGESTLNQLSVQEVWEGTDGVHSRLGNVQFSESRAVVAKVAQLEFKPDFLIESIRTFLAQLSKTMNTKRDLSASFWLGSNPDEVAFEGHLMSFASCYEYLSIRPAGAPRHLGCEQMVQMLELEERWQVVMMNQFADIIKKENHEAI